MEKVTLLDCRTKFVGKDPDLVHQESTLSIEGEPPFPVFRRTRRSWLQIPFCCLLKTTPGLHLFLEVAESLVCPGDLSFTSLVDYLSAKQLFGDPVPHEAIGADLAATLLAFAARD